MHASLIPSARHAARARAATLRLSAPRLRTYNTNNTTPVPRVKEEEDPQLAGYPQLPWVSKQTRPARGWDDPQMRRNFGEPLHEKEEALGMWGLDAPVVPPQTALRHFTIMVLGFVSFAVIVKFALVPERPAVPRAYPYSGLVTELGGYEARSESAEEEES